MESRNESKNRFGLWTILAGVIACVAVGITVFPRPAPLTATEAGCVGSWAYMSPDNAGTTCIVYHFASDRSVREEHYYLNSAWPTVPRITMLGKWSIDANSRMTIEPRGGISYVRDSMSGWLNEYFDDGREGWARPALTRFYDVQSVTNEAIQVEANRGDGGRQQFLMLPFTGDPASALNH
jgi:hypothetical protein